MCCNLLRRNMITVVEHNSSRSAQVEMKNVVAIILVVVVAVEVACDITSIQKVSHCRSRGLVSGSCQYLGKKRLISHVLYELLFTLINDDNAGERRLLTTKTSCAKFKIWRFEFEIVSFYWLKILHVSIGRHARFGGRHTKNPILVCQNRKSVCRKAQPPTNQIFGVYGTRRVPIRTLFLQSKRFSEKLFCVDTPACRR
jgi:hypothetical protein